jgi:hypothetical protein
MRFGHEQASHSAALAFALAAGTVIDAVSIAQAAHAECISSMTC